MTNHVSHVEEVLAFVHDTKTWRDMGEEEKLEWCRRVALVLNDSTNNRFGEWSQTALAPILGVHRQTLGQRLSWSEDVLSGDHRQAITPGSRKVHQRASDARRYFADPAIVGERKAEIVAEALSDDYVAEQVAARITSDPDLFDRLEKARKRLDKRERPDTPPLSLAAEWHSWLNRLNGVLLDGARLAERTETEEDTSVIPQAALYAYQLITERQIDAELRALTESENIS